MYTPFMFGRPPVAAAALAGVAMLATSACGATTDTSESGGGGGAVESESTLSVGVVLPLSGPASYFGKPSQAGISLAVDEINAKGGIGGKDVSVEFQDSKCDPLGATQATKRLVQQQVNAIIGDECSSATLAAMEIVDQAQIPLVNAGSSAIAITDPGNDWTFRIMPNEVMQGVDLATRAYKDMGARNALLLHETTDAGIGNAKVFAETFTSLGGTVVDNIGFDRELQDFSSIATRVASAGKVDVIPTYTLEGQGVNITNALAQAGVTVGGGGNAIQLGTIWLPATFESQVSGDAAEGYVRILQFVNQDPDKTVRDFISKYKDANGSAPNHISAHSYDAMNVILAAAQEAGSTAPAALQGALRDMSDYDLVTGTLTFDENKDPACSCPNQQQNIEMDTIHYVETQKGGSLKLLN